MDELSPAPIPHAEPPTPPPGGPDALPLDPEDKGQPHDLEPAKNPAVDGMPAEVAKAEPSQDGAQPDPGRDTTGADADAGSVD